MPRCLFVAIGDTPAEHEVEFNRWYDEEHIPLLRAVPGVISARRFMDPCGKPRYIALYEMAEASVPECQEWRAALQTPWFKHMDRITANCEWIVRVYNDFTHDGVFGRDRRSPVAAL